MFSVVIPAFNAEKFIAVAIESVLQQTYSDFEIIVVDDGSSDATNEVVSKISDARIKYIYQENAGVSVARNTGIENADGEYICFLDSDDEWLPNHLETMMMLISSYPECSVYLTGWKFRLLSGKIVPHTQRLLRNIDANDFSSDNGYELLWKYGYILNTNSICFEKRAIDKVGLFEPGVKNGEDDDMWYRLLTYYSIAVSKTPTTIYNRENSGATAKTMLVKDWVFLKRVDEIFSSDEVTAQKKAVLKKLLERKKLSRIRQEILEGNKKSAFKKLVNLKVSLLPRKKYMTTWLALAIPKRLVKAFIDTRDKDYYSDHK